MPMKFEPPVNPPIITGHVGTPSWSPTTWPHPPVQADDGRERIVTDVNLWHKATERLAYPAGQAVPVDELPDLIAEPDMLALHRAGKRADECLTPPPSSTPPPMPPSPATPAAPATRSRPPSTTHLA